MNRKVRTRRSKIPMSIRSGDAGLGMLGGEHDTQAPSDLRTGAETEPAAGTEASSGVVGPQSEAPALTFPLAPPRPVAELAEPPLAERILVAPPPVQPTEKPEGAAVHPDDVSVPPVGLDGGGFFDHERSSADFSLELEARDLRAFLRSTPGAARRRAQLVKYVAAAVGFAAILCAAAVVKITVARGHEDLPRAQSPLSNTATTERAPSPAQAPNSAPGENVVVQGTAPAHPVEAPLEPVAAAQAQAGAAPPAPDPSPAAASPAPRVEVAPAPVAAAAPAEAAPTAPDMARLDPQALAKEAGKEKAKARGALEWGKMGAAIEAGERSVAIDPTDGEAWLILGAAYQQKGDVKNAVRSFKACLDQGKRGPRGECAAMMH